MFMKIGAKRNLPSDMNLGVALCKLGMAIVIKNNTYNFIS